MIPIRLEIENFLSYGKRQVIEFAGYPLICLSGKNGHGKSALLDAMTWAIWGQARKVSHAAKPDDNLLRIGQTFMTVIFEFEFNNHKYRIKREYAKTYAKPFASLDFGIYDQATSTMRPLTDKTIRATQDKIIETIGLDYDTFVNSAFLRQGGSNEFSKKSAKERKQILSAILGLNQFEELKRRALDKARDLATQKKYKSEHAEKVKASVENSGVLTTQQEELRQAQEKLQQQDAVLQEIAKTIAQTKQQLTAQQEQRSLLTKQHDELAIKKAKDITELIKLWQTWHAVHSSKQNNNREQLEAEKQLVQQKLSHHQQNFEKQLALKEKILHCKEQLATVTHTLKTEHEQRRQEQQLNAAHQELLIKDVNAKLAACTQNQQEDSKKIALTLKEITQLKIDTERLEKTIAEQEKQRPLFEKRKNYYHAWVAQAQQLVKEQTDLTHKKQFSLEQDNPSCPLCEQNLSASRKRFITQKLMEREQFIAARLARLKKLITPLKQALIAEHAQLEEVQTKKQELEKQRVHICHMQKEHEAHLQNTQELEKLHTALTKELSAISTAHSKSSALLKELDALHEKLLATHEPLQIITKELAELEQSYKECPYNAVEHQQDKQKAEMIEKQLHALVQLKEEQEKQTERKHEIFTLFASLRALKKQQKNITEQLAPLHDLDTRTQKLAAEEKDCTDKLVILQKEKDALSREQGRLAHERVQLDQMIKDLAVEQKEIATLDSSSFAYGTIATALGKDGIQALLIEETIPEIEHETNALLGQLTDNQAHVMIESLKDLKKGGTKETLDINISDAQGIRPYEMFSGGEAFRIDFALRIAISKLLARRAGTSLQTLIIDEGFGSQDDEGLARLMEAIYAIQDNFCKIIIVSHLPSMKEQFPVHFVVDKGPQGSTVTVLEQG